MYRYITSKRQIIKFSHRHDSPGCIEIKNINVTITNNTVNFIGYCILGDISIKIDFHIETWQDISPRHKPWE